MNIKPFAWDFHGRRSVRFQDRDYSLPGDYCVTICTQDRKCLFGTIQDGVMQLNDIGRIIEQEWLYSAEIRSNISLGPWVIMPNHLHVIVTIRGEDDSRYVTIGSHHEKTNAAIKTVGAIRWVAPNQQVASNQEKVASVYQGRTSRNVICEQDETLSSKKKSPVLSYGATQRVAPTVTNRPHGPSQGSIGAIIGQFKQAAARRIRLYLGQPSFDVWQRNYWESCLNTEQQYTNAEDYILDNIKNWERDESNPSI